MVIKNHALLDRIDGCTSNEERAELERITSKNKYSATLLPIRTVGVQGDERTYSHSVAISCQEDPDWTDMIYFDRSTIERTTSFQRSVVIRPFITQDFMTGVP